MHLGLQCDEDAQLPKEKRKVLYSKFEETTIPVPLEDGTTEHRAHTKVTLVLADKRMISAAARYGHKNPLFMDTTFAINRYKFSFLSILAMDNADKGVPVCWAVLPDEQATTIAEVLQTFKDAVQAVKPDFEPSCFVTDDSDAEQKAVGCDAASCCHVDRNLPCSTSMGGACKCGWQSFSAQRSLYASCVEQIIFRLLCCWFTQFSTNNAMHSFNVVCRNLQAGLWLHRLPLHLACAQSLGQASVTEDGS